VLAKRSGDPTFKKAMKIFIDAEHVIEVLPEAGKVVVIYNGEKKTDLTEGQVVFNPKTKEGFELFKIIHFKFGMVLIESDIYGIMVNYFNDFVYVKVAPFYRGKLCGLCGDYNMDSQREFVGANGCLYHTPYAFGRTYVIPDGTCKVPEERPVNIDGTPVCDAHHKE